MIPYPEGVASMKPLRGKCNRGRSQPRVRCATLGFEMQRLRRKCEVQFLRGQCKVQFLRGQRNSVYGQHNTSPNCPSTHLNLIGHLLEVHAGVPNSSLSRFVHDEQFAAGLAGAFGRGTLIYPMVTELFPQEITVRRASGLIPEVCEVVPRGAKVRFRVGPRRAPSGLTRRLA